MDPIISDCDQMTEIEADTRRFGALLPRDLLPGRKGSGWMIWDDEDHCIFLDFFGGFEPTEKSKAATAVLEIYYGLRLPYSFRVGFHESEEVARRTMMDWIGVDDTEVNEAESNEPQLNEKETKTG
jgi:hypothetical protein